MMVELAAADRVCSYIPLFQSEWHDDYQVSLLNFKDSRLQSFYLKIILLSLDFPLINYLISLRSQFQNLFISFLNLYGIFFTELMLYLAKY